MTRTFHSLIAAAAVVMTLAPAQAQQTTGSPLTPEEIEQLRRETSAQTTAEIPSPEEIEAQRQRSLDEQRARAVTGYSNDTERQIVTRSISLIGNGTTEPYDNQRVSLWEGTVSSISFYDHMGQAWPVESVSYDRLAVAVNNEGCDGRTSTTGGSSPARLAGVGNIITVMPCAFWTNSTMQVLLNGETRPILFNVQSGSRDTSPIVDGAITVAVQSDIGRPYGQSRVGTIDNSWVVPSVRTMTIDPIDTRADNRVNEIYVMNGVTTDISFMDANKNPWPVEEIVFPPGLIAVNGPCAQQEAGLTAIDNNDSSTLYLTACMDARATIGVRLKGRAGAISLLTIPAKENIVQPDGTLSVTVSGASPVTPQQTLASVSSPGRPTSASGYGIGFTHDRYLDDFLMATPPQGSRRANIMGGGSAGVEGWFFDGALYVRGSFTVVNPANDAEASSGDGTVRVFKYGPPVSRILGQDLLGREFVLNID